MPLRSSRAAGMLRHGRRHEPAADAQDHRSQSVRREGSNAPRQARRDHSAGKRHGEPCLGRQDRCPAAAPRERQLVPAGRRAEQCAGPPRPFGEHQDRLDGRCRQGLELLRQGDRLPHRRRGQGVYPRCGRPRLGFQRRDRLYGLDGQSDAAGGEGSGGLRRRHRSRRRPPVRRHRLRPRHCPRPRHRQEAVGEERRLADPLLADGIRRARLHRQPRRPGVLPVGIRRLRAVELPRHA